MRLFYGHLRSDDVTKAEALRRAQKDMLGDTQATFYRHPGYWAPFVLINDWL